MAGFKAWNIRDLSVSLNAVPLADAGGLDGDETLTVEFQSEAFDDEIGADGEVTRFNTNDDRATATIKCKNTSALNDRLSALFIADRLLPNGGGAGMFKATDENGRLVIMGARAWVKSFPNYKASTKVSVIEWKIRIADASSSFFGGR